MKHTWLPVVWTLMAATDAAHAQTGSAMWLANVDAPDGGTTVDVTLSLMMEADTPFFALNSTIFDTLNAAGADFGDITSWKVLNGLADLTGDVTFTEDDDNLYGTNAGQLTVFGPFTTHNPIDILSFRWEAVDGVVIGGDQAVTYSTRSESVWLWAGDDKETAEMLDMTAHVSDVTFAWTVVPAPAGAALIGLGGLAVVRRRRED